MKKEKEMKKKQVGKTPAKRAPAKPTVKKTAKHSRPTTTVKAASKTDAKRSTSKKKVAKKTVLGIPGITMPDRKCDDRNCPFHGKLAVRGRVFEGEVISDKMDKSVTVQFGRLYFIPKYERYEKRKTKIKAHNPPCIDAKQGDYVKIIECRPLSKTKNFVVIACESSKS